MLLNYISILKDNYVWILSDRNRVCIIIDPGEAIPIIQKIEKEKWYPEAILLTHKHNDHTNGVNQLLKKYKHLMSYGPNEINNCIITQFVNQNTHLSIFKKKIKIINTPGHTQGHLSYYIKPYLFCGDLLFSGGCGRTSKKNHKDMYNSIKKILNLPKNTLICCAHEYTLSNLKFSHYILPEDKYIKHYQKKVTSMFKNKNITLPSKLNIEKKINLFLRTNDNRLKKSKMIKNNIKLGLDLFCFLRNEKDLWNENI